MVVSLWAAASRDKQTKVQTVTVANLTLDSESFTPVDPRNDDRTLGPVQDGLVLGFDDDETAALKVTDQIHLRQWQCLLVSSPLLFRAKAEDYQGTWNR